jgi:hypothetical protein
MPTTAADLRRVLGASGTSFGSSPNNGEFEAISGPLGARSTRRVRALDWPELEAVLPDGGLPAGVSELAFELIVIDVGVVPGATARTDEKTSVKSPRGRWPMEVLVRKLALLAEEHGASILLLSDTTTPRNLPWPVALRLELARISEQAITVRVAKERRGRVGGAMPVRCQRS